MILLVSLCAFVSSFWNCSSCKSFQSMDQMELISLFKLYVAYKKQEMLEAKIRTKKQELKDKILKIRNKE